jgi:hypothetical protein
MSAARLVMPSDLATHGINQVNKSIALYSTSQK